MTKVFLSSALIALSIATIAVYVYRDDALAEQNQLLKTTTKTEGRLAADMTNATSVAPNPTVKLTNTSTPTTIIADYSRSKNARAFVEEAKQRPHEGGYEYALNALSYCGVSKHLKERPYQSAEGQAEYARRQEVTQFWRQRCGNILNSETGGMHQIRLENEGMAKGDRLLLLSIKIQQALASKNTMALRSGLQELLAIKDPSLLHDLLRRISRGQTPPSASGLSTVWFEGQVLADWEVDFFLLALDLIPCSFGIVCDQYDIYVAEVCVKGKGCYANRTEYLHMRFTTQLRTPATAEESFQKMLRYSQRIVAAIQREDVNAFLRPQ